jgi:hypothetical protein
MADRVMPIVHLIFPCDDAVIDLADGKWVLRNPQAITYLPPGASFPFRESELWVYAQLTGGLGRWELAVEVRQKRDDGSYRFVGIGATTELEFEPGPRLVVEATAFGFRNLPFREEGLYEFRVIAQMGDAVAPTYEALSGPVAELRKLDRRGTL